MLQLKRNKQCAKCPWKVSTDPRQIPNGYSTQMHKALKRTIADPGSFDKTRAMACHESPVGDETYCIGWLNHQLGVGNNIGLRFTMMSYDLSEVETFGEQHKTFEETLPRRRKRDPSR